MGINLRGRQQQQQSANPKSFFSSLSAMTEVSSMNDVDDEYEQEAAGLTR